MSTSRPRSEKARSTTSPTAPSSPVTERTRTSSCSSRAASSRLACTAPRIASASSSSSLTTCPPARFPATRHRSTGLFLRQRTSGLAQVGRYVINYSVGKERRSGSALAGDHMVYGRTEALNKVRSIALIPLFVAGLLVVTTCGGSGGGGGGGDAEDVKVASDIAYPPFEFEK